jgi:hypothetical protein
VYQQAALVFLIFATVEHAALCMLPPDSQSLRESTHNDEYHHQSPWVDWWKQFLKTNTHHKVLCEKEDWRSASLKVMQALEKKAQQTYACGFSQSSLHRVLTSTECPMDILIRKLFTSA